MYQKFGVKFSAYTLGFTVVIQTHLFQIQVIFFGLFCHLKFVGGAILFVRKVRWDVWDHSCTQSATSGGTSNGFE